MIPAARPVPASRVLPHNLESERAILGGVLLRPSVFAQIADVVTAEDYYDPKNQAIHRAIVDLVAAGKPVDEIMIAEQMRTSDTWGRLRAAGNELYFAELCSQVVTVENIVFHARMVRGKANVRQLIEQAHGIAAEGYGEYGDADEYLERSAAAVLSVVARGSGQSSFISAQDATNRTVRGLEVRFEARGSLQVPGLPSGYPALDEATTGFGPGELVIVGGRPSQGKTSFVMDVVTNGAKERGAPALVFTREMPTDSLVLRMISGEARVPSSALRTLNLNGRDWTAIVRACSVIGPLPIWFDDATSTVAGIEAVARRWAARPEVRNGIEQSGNGAIVVDYLQLLSNPIKGANREREIADSSRRLKLLAKELKIPVIALSQLNRSVEREKDKRPRMSDLRESGAIEQDADVIMFIYRDEVYNKDSPDKGIAEIIIGKQRNGGLGTVRLAFLGQYTRFEALAADDARATADAHWQDE